jgi:hypothetical protein
MLGKSHGETIKGEAPDWVFWKPEMLFDKLARHAVDFWLTSEDLPDPENRVTTDATGRIVLHLTENNMEGHVRLAAKLKEMLQGMDCEPLSCRTRSISARMSRSAAPPISAGRSASAAIHGARRSM